MACPADSEQRWYTGLPTGAVRGVPCFAGDRAAETSTALPAAVQIALSDHVLFKFRAYTMFVMVSRSWRIANNLSANDIIAACMAPSVYLSSSLHTPIKCSKCGEVLTVLSKPDTVGPDTSVPGKERYTFTLKSRCTSSKEHLHSSLVLGIHVLPLPYEPVFSKEFVVQSRVKAKKHKSASSADAGSSSLGNTSDSAGSTTAPSSEDESSTASGTSSTGSFFQSTGTGPLGVYFAPTSTSPRCGPSPLMPTTPGVAPPHFSLYQAPAQQQQQPQTARALYILSMDFMNNLVRGKAFARIGSRPALIAFLRSSMHKSLVEILFEELHRALQEIGLELDMAAEEVAPHIFLLVRTHDADDSIEQGVAFTRQFVCNTVPGRPNPFGVDLLRSGLLEVLGEIALSSTQAQSMSPPSATSSPEYPLPVLSALTATPPGVRKQ